MQSSEGHFVCFWMCLYLFIRVWSVFASSCSYKQLLTLLDKITDSCAVFKELNFYVRLHHDVTKLFQ